MHLPKIRNCMALMNNKNKFHNHRQKWYKITFSKLIQKISLFLIFHTSIYYLILFALEIAWKRNFLKFV